MPAGASTASVRTLDGEHAHPARRPGDKALERRKPILSVQDADPVALQGHHERQSFPRLHRTHGRRIPALVAVRAATHQGHAQRGGRGVRRRGLCPLQPLWLDHRHAQPEPPGRWRSALRELSHHSAVLAHPSLHADRAQPPCGGHARDFQLRHRIPEHARRDPAIGRDAGRDAARPGF